MTKKLTPRLPRYPRPSTGLGMQIKSDKKYWSHTFFESKKDARKEAEIWKKTHYYMIVRTSHDSKKGYRLYVGGWRKK
jgi:hypothetical protein